MQQNLTSEESKVSLNQVVYLVGDRNIMDKMRNVPVKKPFDEEIIEFLNELSRKLMGTDEAKKYPDIVSLGFWIRKASIMKIKSRALCLNDNIYQVGWGIAFHIAPSNVPVNYAYSLVMGLLTGNANIVRVPSKEFPQVAIINKAINEMLNKFINIKSYICLIRYEKNQLINDYLSSIADIRLIWGGDNSIEEIRKSPLGPRATEITFADRYSLAVIDSDKYLALENKEKFAQDFYNDTYLSDQNACTSPRIVIWLGKNIEAAKEIFWQLEHAFVKKKYIYQPIMGVNKLTSSYLAAVKFEQVKVENREDNYIVRVKVPTVDHALMKLKDNSGYFFEYDCSDIMELVPLCNDVHCQTIGFFGEKKMIMPLIQTGIKGIDRIVPIGKTMDFDFIWDGYNLTERLTRTISIQL